MTLEKGATNQQIVQSILNKYEMQTPMKTWQ